MTSTAPLSLSAVIPTKNRADDLGKAVASILAQTRPADELVVIDQSPGPESSALVHAMVPPGHATRLVYIHDPSISGLVDAKRVATTRAAGDVICFLEDDIVLESDYLQQIEAGFLAQPDMRGCSGAISNQPRSSPVFVAIHSLFFRGIFHDPRIRIFSRTSEDSSALVQCDVLSGGLSAWRREVFERVAFDTRNGFFMSEDIEFSTRVVRTYGHCLYVNPRARLLHAWSPVNRDVQNARQRRKLAEAVTYYKTRRGWPGARTGISMAMVWYLAEALFQAARFRSPGPMTGYFRGVLDGIRRPLVK